MENMTVIEQAVMALTMIRESAAKAAMPLADHERDSLNFKNLKEFIENISLEAPATEEEVK